MKVLFITYPMAFHTPGGGEIQLLAYKKALENKGVRVDLFNPWKPNFLDYDLVHYFSCVGGSVHICNFIRNLEIPLVITSSLWVTEETKHLYPVDEIRHQLSLADAIVANSDMEGDELARVFGLQREVFHTVYNGVEDDFFKNVDECYFRDEFKIYEEFVLNVGNIEPRKNQLNLVQAMKNYPDKKLVLIGHIRDAEYFEKIKNVATEGQLVYLGPLKHDSILLRSAYSGASVFCLPSTLETPGLAALEAMASGCKCIVTSEGSTKEYFGDHALYCQHDDIESISACIGRISEKNNVNYQSVSAVKSWAVATNALIEIYEKVKKSN
ncbi:glycosyltransferase [Enterovibrio sp. ZSDZ35]|uniref:Glycosyltransferase n=1 Tax=Enterovibrio qingdaonensis TaxID=2899818 RepID=A0ABT5QNB3_9GAMM|nr:glycosyltransferase [Enterovibrio sp. ZSDZ35]MDD1782483.1 glycosyltransferase [Enterovibrio sp. ZSDZ35]